MKNDFLMDKMVRIFRGNPEMNADEIRKQAGNYLRKPYNRIFTRDTSGWFKGSIPDFPGCTSIGNTAEEAAQRLEENAYIWLMRKISSGCVPEVGSSEERAPKASLEVGQPYVISQDGDIWIITDGGDRQFWMSSKPEVEEKPCYRWTAPAETTVVIGKVSPGENGCHHEIKIGNVTIKLEVSK
jgi:predicted RNase H-like HicB family nuclease